LVATTANWVASRPFRSDEMGSVEVRWDLCREWTIRRRNCTAFSFSILTKRSWLGTACPNGLLFGPWVKFALNYRPISNQSIPWLAVVSGSGSMAVNRRVWPGDAGSITGRYVAPPARVSDLQSRGWVKMQDRKMTGRVRVTCDSTGLNCWSTVANNHKHTRTCASVTKHWAISRYLSHGSDALRLGR